MPGNTYEDLLNFLDYLSDKGLVKEGTVASRKAVAKKVFSELDETDRSDVLALDFETAIARFVNKAGAKYSPSSLQTYKTRLRGTLDDFERYRADPMGFKPTVAQRSPRKEKVEPKAEPSVAPSPAAQVNSHRAAVVEASANIVPIPIRQGVIVRIEGLPHDLKPTEADKIAAVVRAFVGEV